MELLASKAGRPRGIGTTVVAACLAAALAGCAPSAPDLESRTGKELQAQVLAVSAAAAAQDPATGLRSLDELVGHLTAAAANGEVSFKRHQSIMKAVEAVRADLLAAQAAKAAAAKAEAARAAAAKASAEAAAKAAAETAAAQSAVVSQAPARASGPAASRPPAGESRDKAPAGESRDKGSNKGKGGGG